MLDRGLKSSLHCSGDWDEHNLSHIAQHGVTPEEVQEVIENSPDERGIENRRGEMRFVEGETDSGRRLVVVATWRGGLLRVVTAYPVHRKKPSEPRARTKQ